MSTLPYIDPHLTTTQYINYFDRKTARDFSAVNKQARAIYLSDDVQKALISKYFRCALSTTRPLKDQYLGLAIAHVGRSTPVLTESIPTEGYLRCLKVNSYGIKALFYYKEKHDFNLMDISSTNYNQTIYNFPGYKEWFGQTRMNAKSTRILSVYHDRLQGKILKYCNAEKGDKFISLSGYKDKDFRDIQMNDEGTRALSLSSDFELILWDLDENKSVNAFSGIRCFKMLSDGKTALLGSTDGILKLLNMMDNECFDIAYSHKNEITCLQINRDGTRVLSGSSDGIIRYCDLSLNGPVSTIPGTFTTLLSVNADGTRALLQSHEDGKFYLWDLKTNQPICSFLRPSTGSRDEESGHHLRMYSMSGDGSRALMLAEWDLKLELWDLTIGKCIYIFPKNTFSVLQMQKSDDELQAILYRSNSTIEVWDLAPSYPTTRSQDHSSNCCPLF